MVFNNEKNPWRIQAIKGPEMINVKQYKRRNYRIDEV